MRIRGALALSLTLVLIAASLVGLVGHEHEFGADSASVSCAVDHEQHQALSDGAAPRLEAAGELHEHRCLGCRHVGSRGMLIALLVTTERTVDHRITRPSRSWTRAVPAWDGRTLRGPPAA